ncbi:Pkinase-domain-containing protein [Neolentinus lepideus HHB14362 ss-1]|uniref:mitogen-activated protein kinase kinase kinase n=1 Tax=Neolentinus lepideus HHB14362 ss-1 TaxID=1314782 RepID=A0A165T9V4_9AGAM|nr:Pkinase-domain-containing protein [Neolentinus lepideus HHB14362 ss-1]
MNSFEGSSHSVSQTSSPTSPTASYHSYSHAGAAITASNARSVQNSSRSGTPSSAGNGPSLESPSGTPFSEFIRSWSDAHVARWLTDIKCERHAPTFRENDIRGDVILELDQTTLKEMGISSIGDRLRITNAVKTLRQKSSSRSSMFVSHSRGNSVNGSGSYATFPNSRGSSRRLEAARPAPLQLSGNPTRKDLPQLIYDHQPPPESAKSSRLMSRLGESTATGSAPGAGNAPSSSRSNLPPIPPAPASRPPLPASNRSNSRDVRTIPGRKTPTQQGAIPSYVNQPLPPAPVNQNLLTPPTAGPQWAGGYGLPSDPRPGNLGGKTPTRSTSPLPNVPGRDTSRSPNPNHGRNASLPGSSGFSSRPTTNGSHPYASSQGQSLPVPSSQLAHNLSPIAESFVSHTSSTSGTPSPPTAPFTVGRGPFTRPHTPSHTAAPSLDDLKRKLVKFTLADGNFSRTVDVSDCAGGIEVLEKVLRKFGKLGSKKLDSDSLMELAESIDGGLVLDGWGVVLDWGQDDETAKPLSEAALLSVCHADPDDPARQRGLTVRRTGKAKRSKPLAHIYGEQSATSSPTTSLFGAGRLSTDEDEGGNILSPTDAKSFDAEQARRVYNKRASSISVLSGLGVKDPEKVLDPPASPSKDGKKSPAASINNKKGPSKLRNFFGQRPPSELITSHLPEYFPFTEKKILQRTARNSMLRVNGSIHGGRRDSTASFATQSHSRFSVSTLGSQRRSISPSRASISSPPPTPLAEEPPRLSLSTEDGQSLDLHAEERRLRSKRDSKPLLPPVDLSSESFAESMESLTSPGLDMNSMSQSQSRVSKGISYITELRSKRDISDTASMMTVDEITAEVENRRMSKAFPVESAEDWTQVESEDSDEEFTETEVGVEVEEAEELEEDEEVEVDESVKRIKWIKGALIGAGSFGKVYLGMDASSGTLMAVKQVELPKSSGPSEQRKRSMLDALDREIELLKTLQHENIVQYLDSSADEEFLNIFLEYVPGGSVAALLREYGSFEEILVQKFVTQILQGLNYLHERDIVHRDIKGANILVDNKGGVKISDFGISKKVQDNLLNNNARGPRISLQGSVFWMAPEVVKQSAHTIKADVWSLGCLIVEMLTGEHPFPQLNQMQAIFKIGQSAKPTIPADISAEAEDFLQRTFELSHEARPTAGILLEHPWIARNPSTKLNS